MKFEEEKENQRDLLKYKELIKNPNILSRLYEPTEENIKQCAEYIKKGGIVGMLFQELGKMKRSWIMISLILIAFGIVMILCPVRYMGMMISALGYVLLVWASVLCLNYLSSQRSLMDNVALAAALFIGILGLFVLVYRRDVLPTLGLLFGLFLIFEGLSDLFSAFVYARRAGQGAWWFLAILSIITIAFGVILLINPWWETPFVLKRVIGGMLLFASAASIIRTKITWPFKSV
jgi:uncharacterized membrane protein HdeD (DUF308 family)